jgi:serine protease Do
LIVGLIALHENPVKSRFEESFGMTATLTKFPIKIGKQPSGFAARRVIAIAGVASIILVGAGMISNAGITSAAYAETVQSRYGFADVVDKIKPAVISVRAKLDTGARTMGKDTSPPPGGSTLDQFFRGFGLPNDGSTPAIPHSPLARQGSGFFISADGYAVTNNHVIEGVKSVEVTTDSGKVYPAKVVGTDGRTDIALIKIDGDSDFPTAEFAERIPRVGDWVLAVGNPFGLGGTVTGGIVSARGRDIGSGPYDDFIQIDAPVNTGNSGGPTFDVDGNVIGVNTAIVSPTGGSVGIAFAIPVDTIKLVITQLKAKGKVTRGWIGVQIQGVTPDIAENLGLKEARGALVAEPRANGPAIKAGIEAGDVITAINGKEISDSREFARTIGSMAPGTSVKFNVISKGEEKTFTITLGELPNQREAAATPGTREPKGTNIPQLGLAVAPRAGTDGVIVTDLDPDGPAADYGFETGDVILEVAGKKVASVGDIRNAIQAAEKSGRRTMLMRVKSGDATRYVTCPVARG